LRIGLDVDGVMYKFFSVYNKHLMELGHEVDLDGHPEEWDYFDKYGYSVEEFKGHLDELVDSKKLFWTGDLYDSGIPWFIQRFRELGHTVHIVTNRYSGKQECSQEATKHYFKEEGIEYDSLTFTADKTSVPVDIFLEDHPGNYDALDAAGVEVWLVDRPYNMSPEGDDRRRVRTFGEFAEKIFHRSFEEQAYLS